MRRRQKATISDVLKYAINSYTESKNKTEELIKRNMKLRRQIRHLKKEEKKILKGGKG